VARGAILTRFNALILAGERSGGDPLARHLGVPAKALIEIGGQPMLAHVISTLRTAGADVIGVSASDPQVIALAQAMGCEIIRAASGPSESAAEGFQRLGAPMLLTTADHALLRPEWVRHFMDQREDSADVSVLLAKRETIERAAPGTQRTYLAFADGKWSGCNLFFFATPRATAALALWTQVEADRKRPWRIVRKLGPALLLRYLLGRLKLKQAIAHLGALAGLEVQTVESPFGLAAIDVDKPADLELVKQLTDRIDAPWALNQAGRAKS